MKRITFQSIFFPFIIFLTPIILLTTVFAQSDQIIKKRPPHNKYGNVIINNFSEEYDMPPVVFKHWIHRARYTCSLCHVEIGFVMKAGGTGMRMDDNEEGLYCGTCHNGVEAFDINEERMIGGELIENCDRCHSYGKEVKFEENYSQFTKNFPVSKFGNGIDWIKAKEKGLLKLKDYVKGVSVKRRQQENPANLEFKPKVVEMPAIIFSHEKHAVWNSCELCHPDLFSTVRGESKYSMDDIFAGKYCGRCHGKVSFPTLDCRRCHTKEVK